MKSKGISCQYVCVESPHQISIDERNHGVLLSTMRAIMALSHAPVEFWAAALKYSAVLNNNMASKYKSNDTAHIPWLTVGMAYAAQLLHPFGCFCILHKTKHQVIDGKTSVRGVYGVYLGIGLAEGVKGIRAITNEGKIEHSAFFTCQDNYFPWRPPGNRLLLNDGTFGNERETTELFKDIKAKYPPNTNALILESDTEDMFSDSMGIHNQSNDANIDEILSNARFTEFRSEFG